MLSSYIAFGMCVAISAVMAHVTSQQYWKDLQPVWARFAVAYIILMLLGALAISYLLFDK